VLARGCTHLLFIDSDMSFPANGLKRLLDADKDIIGANYVRRVPPFRSIAQALDANTRVSGIDEVRRVPTGFMLIKTPVFQTIPEPWFNTHWDESAKVLLSEDYYFCDKAREHGFSVWVDAPLSLEIAHWGAAGYRISVDPPGVETIYTTR
jgi:hypothetical protein